MMKRFFYPRKLLHCVYCPKLGKRFIKVDYISRAGLCPSKMHPVRRQKSTVCGTVIPVA